VWLFEVVEVVEVAGIVDVKEVASYLKGETGLPVLEGYICLLPLSSVPVHCYR
jgi:hypothetical protein